jgi:hypothetical protein
LTRAGLLIAILTLASSCKRAEGEPSSSRPASSSAAKPPEPGTLRFAVVGDFGMNTDMEGEVAHLVKSWNPDFVITTGDNNYPDGKASSIDVNIGKYYAEFIGNYHGKYGPGSTTNRFWPSPGNHDWQPSRETDVAVAGTGLAPYTDYFTLPGNERYYDVAIGLVHLFALDSDPHEPDGTTADSTQGRFLKEHLALSKSCYDLVYFHHPPYSTGKHGSSTNMRWPFKQWGAEAVLSGHDHTYERLEVDGLPYMVVGLGGASRYEFASPPLPETKFRFNDAYGAMLVTATPSAITYEFYTTDGTKRDALSVAGHCNGAGSR